MNATKAAGMIVSDQFLAEVTAKKLLPTIISDLVRQIGYRLVTDESKYADIQSTFYKLVPVDSVSDKE